MYFLEGRHLTLICRSREIDLGWWSYFLRTVPVFCASCSFAPCPSFPRADKLTAPFCSTLRSPFGPHWRQLAQVTWSFNLAHSVGLMRCCVSFSMSWGEGLLYSIISDFCAVSVWGDALHKPAVCHCWDVTKPRLLLQFVAEGIPVLTFVLEIFHVLSSQQLPRQTHSQACAAYSEIFEFSFGCSQEFWILISLLHQLDLTALQVFVIHKFYYQWLNTQFQIIVNAWPTADLRGIPPETQFSMDCFVFLWVSYRMFTAGPPLGTLVSSGAAEGSSQGVWLTEFD